MAKKLFLISNSKPLEVKAIFHLLLLAITLRLANAARILTEDDAPQHVPPPVPEPSNPVPPPVAGVAPIAGPAAGTHTPTSPQTGTISATVADSLLTFFMHDILGGTAPSGSVVAGLIAKTQVNGLPFSKPNSRVFPLNDGVPLVIANSGIINNNGIVNSNNLPFLAGLNGATTSNIINNNGNNKVVSNGNPLPLVTAGQLPRGATLQKLIFGTITVIDNELTEGHELGSSVIGKAHGFYLASSLDGSGQTMAFTALFGENEEDTISFFGVHHTAASESQVAIVGGTGKYENAQGYATIETLHLNNQRTTDGVETLLQFNVYLTH